MFALGTGASYFSMFSVLLKQEYTVPSCRVYSLMTRGHCCPWQGHTGPIQESDGLDRLLVITFISVLLAKRRLGFSGDFLFQTKCPKKKKPKGNGVLMEVLSSSIYTTQFCAGSGGTWTSLLCEQQHSTEWSTIVF